MKVPCWTGEYIASFQVNAGDNYNALIPEGVCNAVKKVQVKQLLTKPALIVVSKSEIKIYWMETLNDNCIRHGLKEVCYVSAQPRSSHLAFVAVEPTAGLEPGLGGGGHGLGLKHHQHAKQQQPLVRFCHIFNFPSRLEAQEVRKAIQSGMRLEPEKSRIDAASPCYTTSSAGSSLERELIEEEEENIAKVDGSHKRQSLPTTVHDALNELSFYDNSTAAVKDDKGDSPYSPRKRLSLLAEEISPPHEPPPSPPSTPVILRQKSTASQAKSRRDRKRFSLPADKLLQKNGGSPNLSQIGHSASSGGFGAKMRPSSGIYEHHGGGGQLEPQSPPAQITRLNDGTELIMKHGLIRFNKPDPNHQHQNSGSKPNSMTSSTSNNGNGSSPSPQRSVPKMGVTAKRRPVSTFVSSDQLNYCHDGTKVASGWTHMTAAASEQHFGTLDESIPSDPLNSSDGSISPHYWQRSQYSNPPASYQSSHCLQRVPSTRRLMGLGPGGQNFFKRLLGRSSTPEKCPSSNYIYQQPHNVSNNNCCSPPPPLGPLEPVKMRDKSKRSPRPASTSFVKQKRASFGGFNISFGRMLGNKMYRKAMEDQPDSNNNGGRHLAVDTPQRAPLGYPRTQNPNMPQQIHGEGHLIPQNQNQNGYGHGPQNPQNGFGHGPQRQQNGYGNDPRFPGSRMNSSASGVLTSASEPQEDVALPVPETEDNFLSEAPWFCAHAPRELVNKLLKDEPQGTFLVRRSTTQLGCYALTVRVGPNHNNSGLANFLILRTYRGYKFKGFTKDFPSVHSLVTHHTIMAEKLPCTLEFSRRVAQWIRDFRALQFRAEHGHSPGKSRSIGSGIESGSGHSHESGSGSGIGGVGLENNGLMAASTHLNLEPSYSSSVLNGMAQ